MSEPGKAYTTPQVAIDDLRPGWTVTGPGRPYYQTEPNEGALANEPPIKATQIGITYPIQGPNGQPDEITLGASDSTYVWNTTPGAPLPKALVVIKGPTNNPATGAGTNKPSDPSKWTPVYRDPGNVQSGQIGQWDPVNNEFHPQAAPPDAKPTGVFDPVIITDPGGGQRQVGMVDQGDKSFHPLAAAPDAKPTGKYDPVIVTNPDGTQRQVGLTDQGDKSFHPLAAPDAKPTGKYDNVFVPNADGTQRIVGMTDTGDHSFHPLAADPSGQFSTIQTPTGVYQVDANGKLTNGGKPIITIDKNVPFQAVAIDGVLYRFDPNEKDPTKSLVKVGPDAPLPKTLNQNGVTYVLTTQEDGTQKYVLPPGVKAPAVLSNLTTVKTLDWYDDQGNLVKSIPNTNYQAPTANAPTPNAVSPYILIPDPDNPGQLKWIENKGRVTASAALQGLASQLSDQVVSGDISVDEATAIINGANTAMQTSAAAANTALDFTSRGAATGAGVLQQRAATAQGVLSDLMRTATQRPLYAGAPDVSGLSGAIANWTAGLMGGQQTLDAASSMVRAASPQGLQDNPMTAAASSALTQMLDRYKQANGGVAHPIEQAHQAAASTVQTGATVAPVTQPWQRVDQMNGAAPAGNAMAPAGVAGAVSPGSPQYLGSFGRAPFAQSGIAEGSSRGFLAPSYVPPPTPTVNINFGTGNL